MSHGNEEGPRAAGGRQGAVFGAAQERTSLAWNRTALGLIAVGALALRVGGPPVTAPALLPGFAAMALGAALLVYGRHRDRRAAAEGVEQAAGPVVVLAVAAGVVALSLTCLVVLVRGAT